MDDLWDLAMRAYRERESLVEEAMWALLERGEIPVRVDYPDSSTEVMSKTEFDRRYGRDCETR